VPRRLPTAAAKSPEILTWADGRAALEFVPGLIRIEWGIELGDMGGNWYGSEDSPMEGWLCPALFRYFEKAPAELYVKAEAKKDRTRLIFRLDAAGADRIC